MRMPVPVYLHRVPRLPVSFKLIFVHWRWQVDRAPIALSDITRSLIRHIPDEELQPSEAALAILGGAAESPTAAQAASPVKRGPAAPALVPVKPSLPSSSAMAAPRALVATVTSKDLAARKGFARAGDHLLKEATLGLAGFEGRQWKTFEVGVDRVARL